MPQETRTPETGGGRLQSILFRPPVSVEDLNTDIEHAAIDGLTVLTATTAI